MRRFLLALSAVAAITAGILQAQTKPSRLVLYAANGPELAVYAVDAADASLTRTSTVALPFAVQYVWPHPSKKFLYAAWSNGMQGDRHGVTAFRVDGVTGTLDGLELTWLAY